MHCPALMKLVLVLGVLVVTLALTGCSSGSSQEEEAKPRPLPEQPQELRPGEYRSEEFRPPFSFRIGKGWRTLYEEAPDYLQMECLLALNDRNRYIDGEGCQEDEMSRKGSFCWFPPKPVRPFCRAGVSVNRA